MSYTSQGSRAHIGRQESKYESIMLGKIYENRFDTLDEGSARGNGSQQKESSTSTKEMMLKILIPIMCIMIVGLLVAVIYLCLVVFTEKTRENGYWGEWEEWQPCSVTCGIGLQRRTRICTNPRLNGLGDNCNGHGIEVKLCKADNCSEVHWSEWTTWGSCSVSCGTGLKKRQRKCTYSSESEILGRDCIGTSEDVDTCHSLDCHEIPVAFNAYSARKLNDAELQPIVFKEILLNEGEAYNSSTGIFVAPFRGIYQFNCHLCAETNKDANYELTIDDELYLGGEFRTPSDADDGKCASFSAVAFVEQNQNVSVRGQFLYQSVNDWNSFSGVLLQKIHV